MEKFFFIRILYYIGKENEKGDEMLVLSRKKDETIIVRIPGREDIKLTVVRIDNLNKVRIGVEADKDVVILRSELDEKIQKASVM
jgi:carbon storage regulator CsrA